MKLEALLGIAVVAAIIISLAAALKVKKKPSGTHYTLQGPLCAPAELRFLEKLRAAIGPKQCVMVKVRLLDLLKPSSHAAMRRVSQKHIDFVICDTRTTLPLYAIELNDKSHERRDRKARDRFLDDAMRVAGLPLLWHKTQSNYDPKTSKLRLLR